MGVWPCVGGGVGGGGIEWRLMQIIIHVYSAQLAVQDAPIITFVLVF